MTNTLLSLIKKLPSITIPKEDGSPYLTRYYPMLKDRVFGNVFIHHFHSSDLDCERDPISGEITYLLHNHPFKESVSFILTNGYFEERRVEGHSEYDVKKRFVRRFTFNYISAKTFHRVELIPGKEHEGVWTIFITGPRIRNGSWGFWNRITNVYKDYRNFAKAVA